MPMTQEQISAVRLVAAGVLDACKIAGPLGAPGGVMFAAMQSQGCTLRQFQSIMDTLERAGKVRKDGDCYIWLADL